MSYYGEFCGFSLKDNICEEVISKSFSDITDFFSKASFDKGTIAIGYSSETHKSCAYSISVGVAEHGNNALILEDCALPAFLYTSKKLNVKAGIYIKRVNPLVIMLFDSFGIPLNTDFLLHASNCRTGEGNISTFNQADLFYLSNLKSIAGNDFSADASISCGNNKIRNIWRKFFNDKSDSLSLQISNDGFCVNAYSNQIGFISHEKLMLAYSVCLMKNNIPPILPDYVHFIADELADKFNSRVIRYSQSCSEKISDQLFTCDPLFLCIMLMSQKKDFISLCKEIPDFYTAKREEASSDCAEKSIFGINGKITVTHSGKNRITIAAQAYNAETASELCGDYISNLKKFK